MREPSVTSRTCRLSTEPMTYNFDPDRWYENERKALEMRYREGHICGRQLTEGLDALERRLEEMWVRLDGSYRLPPTRSG